MRRILLMACALGATGCASVVARSHPNADRWYAGTRQDWRDLSIDPWYSQSLDLVDLPLSAVGDTVLLPWDAVMRRDPAPPATAAAPEPTARPRPWPLGPQPR